MASHLLFGKYGPGANELYERRRVQIPAYTDRWMMGDRYGEIVKITTGRKGDIVHAESREIAHVKLDKSGKTLRFVLNDCTPL